jgi:hypothetical protein
MQDSPDFSMDRSSRAALGKMVERAQRMADPERAIRFVFLDLVKRGAGLSARRRMIQSLSLIFGEADIEQALHRPGANDP